MYRNTVLLWGAACLLSACAAVHAPLTDEEKQATISADIQSLYPDTAASDQNKPIEMSIDNALQLGLRKNLDLKVASLEAIATGNDALLEKLNALPSSTLTLQNIGRTNPGASSSRSITTGTQSLEPSISTEQYRSTVKLEQSFDVLDLGLTITRSKSASDRTLIALERRRKVAQNLMHDIYSAYWRAKSAQELDENLKKLSARVDAQLANLKKADAKKLMVKQDYHQKRSALLNKRNNVKELSEQLALAEIELKTLIGLPLDQEIHLTTEDMDVPSVKMSLEEMENYALQHRPEVQEALLNSRIAERNVRLSIYESFPGLEVLFAFNRDENKFLQDADFVSHTVSLTQNITRLLTLPARHRRAKNEVELEQARRQALLAAVLTQVQVAYNRYEYNKALSQNVKEINDSNKALLSDTNKRRKVGLLDGSAQIEAELDAAFSNIEAELAYADAQASYMQLLNAIGADSWTHKAGEFVELVKASETNEMQAGPKS